jgi:hypothetical protein
MIIEGWRIREGEKGKGHISYGILHMTYEVSPLKYPLST